MKQFLEAQTSAQLRAKPKCAHPSPKDKPWFIRSGLGSRCMGLLLLLLAALLLAQSALAQNDTICDPFDGDIDDDDNGLIEICYLEDLDAVRYQPDGTGYTTGTGAVKITAGCPDAGCNGYELSRDLDFLDNASYREAEANKAAYTVDDFDDSADQGWDPLGTSFADAFRAIFNGKRRMLSNLRINRPTESNVGLFAFLRFPAKIENVGLVNSEIRGNWYVGGFVGTIRREGVQLSNNYVAGGHILGKGSAIGGLTGEVSVGDFNNSYANVRVDGSDLVGGLFGLGSEVVARNCYASGSVAGTAQVGGFVGTASATLIQNNYAIAMLKANSGGFAGRIVSSAFHNNYWDIERSGQSSSVGEGVGQITGLTTVQMISPTAPGTTVTEAYYEWSEDNWDFGSRYDYPAVKYNDGSGDLLGHQRPATKLSRLLLGIGERTLSLDVEQSVHQQSVDFDIEQISLRAENDSEAILHINGTTATSGEMRSFDLAVARTTTLTLTLSLPYYVWPRIYALEVYRKEPAELSELNISAGQLMPPFNLQTTFYTLSVSATTKTLIVTPMAADPEARVEVNGVEVDDDAPGREIALREGTTTISILVGSPGKTTQSYTLAVRRPSQDAPAGFGFIGWHVAARVCCRADDVYGGGVRCRGCSACVAGASRRDHRGEW